MPSQASLIDIAHKANCSKTTVSLALRNSPRISEATREKIWRIAKELNYRPDPILSEIASRRWRGGSAHLANCVFIAFCNPFAKFKRESSAYERQYCGVQEAAGSLGYSVEHLFFEEEPDYDKLGSMLWARGVTGIVFSQLFSDELFKRVDFSEFSVVCADRGHVDPPFHHARNDMAYAMEWAWRKALAAGEERIGVAILDEPKALDRQEKISTALYFQQQVAESQRVPIINYSRDDPDGELMRWFRTYRPSVVVGFNDCVHAHLTRDGLLKSPEDFRFISLIKNFKPGSEGISGFSMNHELLGETSFRYLDQLVRHNERGVPEYSQIHLIKPVYYEGETFPSEANGGELADSVSLAASG